MWSRILLMSSVLAWMVPALADTVWLNNGDRITGDIVLLDGGKLALKTKYAGQVLIDWKNIDTLRADKPLMLRRDGLDSNRSNQLLAAGKGMVRVVHDEPGGKTTTVPLASITRMVHPRKIVRDAVWEGNLDAKLDLERNEDRSDEFNFRADSRIEYGRWRHVLHGEFEHETKNDIVVDDNWQLEYDIDRFFTNHWFLRTGVEHEQDAFDFVRRQTILGTGPGYRFWDNELGRFDLITQINRIKYRSEIDDLEFNSLSIAWDYKRLIWGTRLEFYTSAETHLPMIDEVDYVIDGEVGLRYSLNSWARLSLLYELDQTRGQGVLDSDRRYLIGVGVAW